jgi:hypothetical protein
MKPIECEFEAEVLAAVLQSRWPERADVALRQHVEQCAICSDAAAIANALDDACAQMRAYAVVPDPGRVWWMVQTRVRREAVKAAGHPITAVQVIALACAVGLLGACFGATSAWFQSALQRILSSLVGFELKMLIPSPPALLAEHSALVLAIAAVILLVPATVFLAILRGETH